MPPVIPFSYTSDKADVRHSAHPYLPLKRPLRCLVSESEAPLGANPATPNLAQDTQQSGHASGSPHVPATGQDAPSQEEVTSQASPLEGAVLTEHQPGNQVVRHGQSPRAPRLQEHNQIIHNITYDQAPPATQGQVAQPTQQASTSMVRTTVKPSYNF
ncbi:hypothetical protein Hypma_015651 [Hypsizygus marmoreus]|uniref:Uncharacterized protein n=1 Tax=Hypsizygus marmoreus TaxID=39966 RepID=A0A369KDM6_HYPMA|nr:hypothetical protein Hypma_015651 [Hypsizygus marmoreus]